MGDEMGSVEIVGDGEEGAQAWTSLPSLTCAVDTCSCP